MSLVRYAALVALVSWVGGLLALQLVVGAVAERFHIAGAACGAVMAIGLLLMKFVGPPPRAFVLRLGIVAIMLLVESYAIVAHASGIATAVNIALGLALLSWYTRE